MIELLSPQVRMLLVESRSAAMRGDLPAAIGKLGTHSGISQLVPLEEAAISMLVAELFYLNFDNERALEVFSADIDPKVQNLSEDVLRVIAGNRLTVAMDRCDAGSVRDFYLHVDEERLADTQVDDSDAVLRAELAAQTDRHYEAFPAFWRVFVRAYKTGDWRSGWVAAGNLGRECLRLGWPAEAARLAILALNEKLAKAVGDDLVSRRDPQLVDSTLDVVLHMANLKRHADTACTLLAQIGDIVPSARVSGLVDWLLPKCSLCAAKWPESNATKEAWLAIKAIAPQFTPEQALAAAKTAIAHPAPLPLREHIIETLNLCVTSLPLNFLPEVVEAALAFLKKAQTDGDWVETINLVCHCAHRGDENIRGTIRDKLYPPGGTKNALLVLVAPRLGKTFEKRESMTKLAEKIAAELPLTVQRLKPDDIPLTVTLSTGNSTKTQDGSKIVVNFMGGHQLEALTQHRKMISPDVLENLINSMLKMIAEQENAPVNKEYILLCLQDFGDVLSKVQASSVFEVLAPIADGKMAPATAIMSEAEADNPLNPFKMHSGKLADVRGIALYALAKIDKLGSFYGKNIDPILEKALIDPNGDVRSWAFRTARERPSLSVSALMALLFWTRDSVPESAAAAFAAIGHAEHLVLNESQWQLLVLSFVAAQACPHVVVRHNAAYSLSRLIKRNPPPEVTERLAELQRLYADDIAFSVRSALGDIL